MFEWVLNAPFKTSIILFHYSFLINISSRSYFTFRAVCIYLFSCVTRIFQGRGVFLENGHFDKHSPIARERKAPQGKNLRVFCLETLKNVILNDKFYLKMTIIREFFLQIRALFSNFQKGQGRPPTLPHSSYAPAITFIAKKNLHIRYKQNLHSI